MSALAYNGHDFSEHVTAELVEPAGHALSPHTLAVPGRPGAALLGCELPPRVLRVRLLLDAGVTLSAEERSAIRHELYGWLCAPEGAELELPGEPGLTWRDVVVTAVSDWDTLFEGGSCEVEFTCLDPVAYGEEKSSEASALTIGGTWATWPVATLTNMARDFWTRRGPSKEKPLSSPTSERKGGERPCQRGESRTRRTRRTSSPNA